MILVLTNRMPVVKTPSKATKNGYKPSKANITPTVEKKCRHPFTDGWNSFWHVALGAWCLRWPILAPGFVWYQLWDPWESNVWIDVFKFLAGFCVMLIGTIGAGVS